MSYSAKQKTKTKKKKKKKQNKTKQKFGALKPLIMSSSKFQLILVILVEFRHFQMELAFKTKTAFMDFFFLIFLRKKLAFIRFFYSLFFYYYYYFFFFESNYA